MSFFDFLKTKQKKEEIEKKKKPIKATFPPRHGGADSPLAKKKEKPAGISATSAAFPPKADSSWAKKTVASKILRKPRITEKAGFVGEQNKYVFDVYGGANKPEVKKAIKEIYGKEAEKINIVNIPPKKKRRGRTEYFKSGLKKAIVTLKEGETIEVMPR